jgi:predicted transcriptional regulator
MASLKFGISDYSEMKARTMRIARGEQRASPSDPKVWFVSTESFAKALATRNHELLRIIIQSTPGSLGE